MAVGFGGRCIIDWRLDAMKIMGTGQCNAVISLLLR